jgi:hypothetical protein
VSVSSPLGKHFLPAFDNTERFVTSVALVNSDRSQPATVTVVFRDEAGQVISSDVLSLGVREHQAFALPRQFPKIANLRGVAEFSSNTELAALGLRFSP